MKAVSTMDKLLALYSNLRKSCRSERKRSKEVISCSDDKRLIWPLRYVPCQQWGKTTFNHDVDAGGSRSPATRSSVLRNTHDKCKKAKFLHMFSNGLARKTFLAEHGEIAASNVMLISLCHNTSIHTNYTGARSADGKTKTRDRNRERDSGAGNCAQKHLLPNRRVRQRTRKARESRRLGLVEDRSGAEPSVRAGHNTAALCQTHRPKNNLVYILGTFFQWYPPRNIGCFANGILQC